MSVNSTARAYVLTAVRIKSATIITPTRGNPGILVYAKNEADPSKLGALIVDAQTWADAKTQINKFFAEQAK